MRAKQLRSPKIIIGVNGNLLGTERRTKEQIVEDFLARVKKTSGCWIWTGGLNKAGYGTVKIFNKPKLAHRVSYEIHVGNLPVKILVCHKCDNPPCVNPDHLFLGTHRDNAFDSMKKGRFSINKRRGSKSHLSRLTESQVIQIRNRYVKGSRKNGSAGIAKDFNVQPNTISKIVTRRTWNHL
jgi:hypothetical protein